MAASRAIATFCGRSRMLGWSRLIAAGQKGLLCDPQRNFLRSSRRVRQCELFRWRSEPVWSDSRFLSVLRKIFPHLSREEQGCVRKALQPIDPTNQGSLFGRFLALPQTLCDEC